MSESEEYYKECAIKLWNIIDDIDTDTDFCKDNYKMFSRLTCSQVKRRVDVFTSDGFDLFRADTGEIVADSNHELLSSNPKQSTIGTLEQQNAELLEVVEDFIEHQEFRESVQGSHGTFKGVYIRAKQTLAKWGGDE